MLHTALRSSEKRCLWLNSGKGLWTAEKHACDLEERATGGWRERGPPGGGTCFPAPRRPQGPGQTPCWTAGRTPGPTPGWMPGWTPRRTAGWHAAAAACVERWQQLRGRAERAHSTGRHGSARNHTSVHRPPGQRRNRGLCGSLGGPPATARVGALRSAARVSTGTVLPPPLLVAEWSVCDAPDGPASRLLSSATTLPPFTTWRRSPDVGGLLGEPADALSACHLPLVSGAPEVVKADRGASCHVRSLFCGVCSTASSLGKLDPGSYRRVSEPQARRVMPVVSLSGWRERRPLRLLWAVLCLQMAEPHAWRLSEALT